MPIALRIAIGFAIMLALPLALSDRAQTAPAAAKAALPSPQTPTIPGSREFWAEGARTLVATATGAWLAFWFNLKVQAKARRRDEEAAANLAMATLILQFNSYLQLRAQFSAEVQRARREAPGAPEWLVASPILHHLRPDLPFDFVRLNFIFEMQRIELFKILHQCEQRYRSMVGFVVMHAAACKEKQNKMEQAGLVGDGIFTIGHVRATLGPELDSRLESLFGAVLGHCREDAPKYLDASAQLFKVIGDRFGQREVFRIAPDQDLPPLP